MCKRQIAPGSQLPDAIRNLRPHGIEVARQKLESCLDEALSEADLKAAVEQETAADEEEPEEAEESTDAAASEDAEGTEDEG